MYENKDDIINKLFVSGLHKFLNTKSFSNTSLYKFGMQITFFYEKITEEIK